MTDLVRVKSPDSGAHITVSAAWAETHSLTPLKQPATDAYGRVLPAKQATDKAGETAAPTQKKESER